MLPGNARPLQAGQRTQRSLLAIRVKPEDNTIVPLLDIRDLNKRFRISGGLLGLKSEEVHAVTDVSFSLTKGETLGLVGESGCGKSTLAKCIMGLTPMTSGEILFKGRSIRDWNNKELRRSMQMVFQDPYSSLNPRQRVGSIIKEMYDIHGVGSNTQRTKKVHELLEHVGLRADQFERYPHEFSGGQRQRVAVARALALDPDLVVCDEPVSALDVSVRAQVLNLLRSLQKQFELTYIFISHDLSVVSHISDRVAVMYLGRIVELAPSQELFAKPLHPYTKALLSAILLPDPAKRAKRIPLSGDLPSPTSPPQGCPFHPRCPEAMEKCSVDAPAFNELTETRQVACWLY